MVSTEPEPDRRKPVAARTAWKRVTEAVDRIPEILDQSDEATGQAHIAVLAETLDALPLTVPTDLQPQLLRAATAFERAGRSRIRARHQQAHATRTAIKTIVSQPAPKDGTALAMLLDALLLAVVAAQHWHLTRHHDQQTEAACRAAEHLRTAYQVAAVHPIAVIHQLGLRLTMSQQRRQGTALR
ncbi:hypothetical protein [Streptomyces sp. NPDC002671]